MFCTASQTDTVNFFCLPIVPHFLYKFISVIDTLRQTMPHIQPSPEELEEMSQRALKVVRLLEDLRRKNDSEGVQPTTPPISVAGAGNTATGATTDAGAAMDQDSPDGVGESSRPPKRPWEDTAQDEGTEGVGEVNGLQDVSLFSFTSVFSLFSTTSFTAISC